MQNIRICHVLPKKNQQYWHPMHSPWSCRFMHPVTFDLVQHVQKYFQIAVSVRIIASLQSNAFNQSNKQNIAVGPKSSPKNVKLSNQRKLYIAMSTAAEVYNPAATNSSPVAIAILVVVSTTIATVVVCITIAKSTKKQISIKKFVVFFVWLPWPPWWVFVSLDIVFSVLQFLSPWLDLAQTGVLAVPRMLISSTAVK